MQLGAGAGRTGSGDGEGGYGLRLERMGDGNENDGGLLSPDNGKRRRKGLLGRVECRWT